MKKRRLNEDDDHDDSRMRRHFKPRERDEILYKYWVRGRSRENVNIDDPGYVRVTSESGANVTVNTDGPVVIWAAGESNVTLRIQNASRVNIRASGPPEKEVLVKGATSLVSGIREQGGATVELE